MLNSSSCFFSLSAIPNLRAFRCLALVLKALLKSNGSSCPRELQIHLQRTAAADKRSDSGWVRRGPDNTAPYVAFLFYNSSAVLHAAES